MAEDAKDTHPDELRSDLDLLVEMANDLKKMDSSSIGTWTR